MFERGAAPGLNDLPFHQIVENLHEIVWLSDAATGQILYIAPNFEAFFGLPREEIYRERITRAIHTEQPTGT